MRVYDLQLTVMASGLDRLLASKIAHGYERAKSRYLFRDFVDATALVHISAGEISVRYQKRAHHPLLLAAGFDKTDAQIPWLGGRRLRLARRTSVRAKVHETRSAGSRLRKLSSARDSFSSMTSFNRADESR